MRDVRFRQSVYGEGLQKVQAVVAEVVVGSGAGCESEGLYMKQWWVEFNGSELERAIGKDGIRQLAQEHKNSNPHNADKIIFYGHGDPPLVFHLIQEKMNPPVSVEGG